MYVAVDIYHKVTVTPVRIRGWEVGKKCTHCNFDQGLDDWSCNSQVQDNFPCYCVYHEEKLHPIHRQCMDHQNHQKFKWFESYNILCHEISSSCFLSSESCCSSVQRKHSKDKSKDQSNLTSFSGLRAAQILLVTSVKARVPPNTNVVPIQW